MAIVPPFSNSDFSPWLQVGERAGLGSSTMLSGLTSFSFEFLHNRSVSATGTNLWQAGGQGILGPSSIASARWALDGSLRVVFDNLTDGGPVLTSTTTLVPGLWYHICGTYDAPSGDLQLIINGVLEDSATSGVPWVGRSVWIKKSGTSEGYYDDERLWNFARTPAQVLADYQAPLAGTESGLIGYWPGDGDGNDTPNVVNPGVSNKQVIPASSTWTWVFFDGAIPDTDPGTSAPIWTAAETSIANAALICLGDRRIVSLNESSRAARILSERFADVRDETLRAVPWNFATKRVQLPADATPPVHGFARAFTLPSDCIRLLNVECDTTRFNWTVEGRKILTSLPAPLQIEYTARITDPYEMDALFKQAFAATLAVESAEAITGSSEKLRNCFDRMTTLIEQAATVNGQEDDPPKAKPGSFELARGREDRNA